MLLDVNKYSSLSLSTDGYYEISSIQGIKDLLIFADNPDYKFKLTKDLDLANEPGLFIPYLAAKEFDGGGKVISNLKIDQPEINKIGLIGELGNGATIKNIGLTNVNGYNSVGGLVGFNNNGNISTSYSSGVISGDSNVGGLVGINDSTISTSYSSGTVTGKVSSSLSVGGLVGSGEPTISNQ